MGMDELRPFTRVDAPLFDVMSQEQIYEQLSPLMEGNTELALAHPVLSLALMSYLVEHRITASRGVKNADVVAHIIDATLKKFTDAQRCDYNVALWVLTGDDKHARVVADFADGVTPTQKEYRGAAEWCMLSISGQSPLWRAAVDRIRALRRGEGN